MSQKNNLPRAFEAAASFIVDKCYSEGLYVEMLEQMADDFSQLKHSQQPDAALIIENMLFEIAKNNADTGCLAALRLHNNVASFREYAVEVMIPCLTNLSATNNSDALKMALLVYTSAPDNTPAEKMALEVLPGLAVTYALLCGSAIETKRLIGEALSGKKDESRYRTLMEVCQSELQIYCPYVGPPHARSATLNNGPRRADLT